MKLTSRAACALLCVFAGSSLVEASLIDFDFPVSVSQSAAEGRTIDLTGVPFGGFEPVGAGTATLDTNTNEFVWDIDYTGLTGPVAVAHFHGPAAPGFTAGVEVTVSSGGDPVSGTFAGSAILSAMQVTDLLDGLWYLNVHTSQNPAGEIRGQVLVGPNPGPNNNIPEPASALLAGLGASLLMGRRRR